MTVPYEQSGRRQQKARTREALVDATRKLLARGLTPTVEESAESAGISRTTAYRYFPNQRTLLLGAHPEIQLDSLLPDDAPADPRARLDLVMEAFTRINLDWEPQLRTSLRLSLELEPGRPSVPGRLPSPAQPSVADPPLADQPVLRQGRAIRWIEAALEPLRGQLDVHRLAIAIRAATGIEALVWLTDIAGLSREEAARTMRWSAHAMIEAALAGDPP